MAFSFEKPTTIEQKVYISECNFFWPFLLPLWNPQSKIHWIKAFLSLDLVGIPPHALHAAVLHGYYVLKGGPKQQMHTDIVMSRFNYPLDRYCWTDIIEKNDINFLKETFKSPEEGWRPLGYSEKRQQLLHDPACRRKKNAKFRHRARYLTPQLREGEKECMAALGHLEQWVTEKNKELEKTLSPTKKRHEANKTYHVQFKKLSARRAAETETICGICQNEFANEPKLDQDIKSHAARLAFVKDPLAKYRKYYRREYQVDAREQWQEMKASLMNGHLQIPQEGEVERLATELLDFKRSIGEAKRHLRHIVDTDGEKERCFHPTKLECGHIMGLDCISKWIKEKPTCPFCRKKLDKPPPQAQKVQQNQILFAQGFEAAIGEGLAGLEGLGGIFLGINAEGDVADDLVLGNDNSANGAVQGMMGFNLGEMVDDDEMADFLEELGDVMGVFVPAAANQLAPAPAPQRRTTGGISLPGYIPPAEESDDGDFEEADDEDLEEEMIDGAEEDYEELDEADDGSSVRGSASLPRTTGGKTIPGYIPCRAG